MPDNDMTSIVQMPEGYVPAPEDQPNLDLLNDCLRDMRELFAWTTPLGDPGHWTRHVTIEVPGKASLAAEAALMCGLKFTSTEPMLMLLIQSHDAEGKVYQAALLRGGENTPPNKLKTILSGVAYDTPGRAVLSMLGACMVSVAQRPPGQHVAKNAPKVKKPKRSLRH